MTVPAVKTPTLHGSVGYQVLASAPDGLHWVGSAGTAASIRGLEETRGCTDHTQRGRDARYFSVICRLVNSDN